MTMQRFFNVLLIVLAFCVLGMVALMPLAHAAPAPTLYGDGGVCDPWYPQNCYAPLGRVNAGSNQYGVSTATAVAPTVPSGATGIMVFAVGTNNASGQCLMWRDDGTDPSGTVGNPIPANVPIWYYVKTSATSSVPNVNFKLITATGATCVANFIYFQ